MRCEHFERDLVRPVRGACPRPLTQEALDAFTAGLGQAQALASLEPYHGITASVGEWQITPAVAALFLAAVALVFAALGVVWWLLCPWMVGVPCLVVVVPVAGRRALARGRFSRHNDQLARRPGGWVSSSLTW